MSSGTTIRMCQIDLQGVQILRVHNVNEIIQSIKVFKELNKKYDIIEKKKS